MSITIFGAGAFGTALAIAFARTGRDVMLWARDAERAAMMQESRVNMRYLPDAALPPSVRVTHDFTQALAQSEAALLAIPMQNLRSFLAQAAFPDALPRIACSKGIDLTTLQGPSVLLRAACAQAPIAVLTGPSFAADLGRGLPTALTLAAQDHTLAERLQNLLATPHLRLYASCDIIGAELGGALKNVMAIAAGVVMGAGLGESARAALITRGYAEMERFAVASSARAETLCGLSGLGDLILTCNSPQSRNFSFGYALGSGRAFDATITVEGAATAKALRKRAAQSGIDMPITEIVARLIDQDVSVAQAIATLLNRPLKKE